MFSRDDVIQALQNIQDPSLHKSMIELGLLRDFMVKENEIRLTAVLMNDDDQAKESLSQQIKERLRGEQEVHIRFRKLLLWKRNKS